MGWIRGRLRGFLASHLPAGLFTHPDLFDLYERRGWHITPVHFYQPIPDSRELLDRPWSSRSSMPGVDMNEQFQLELLSMFGQAFGSEYEQFLDFSEDSLRFHFGQTAFRSVDAECLYCMIRHFKPRQMIEVGSGVTTLLAAEAIRKNEAEGHSCAFTAIEPYPPKFLRGGVPGLTELLEVKVEAVPIHRFCALEENDILFIDSSHVIKIGGDVLYEYLEIMPRLKPGVIVHCHDIFLPAEYPKSWVLKNHWFWTEQYLLQAFLAFNNAFHVLLAGSFLHLNHPEKLKAAFTSYDPTTVWPGSFWMRRVVPTALSDKAS
jgi:hypothetical protein